MRSSLLKKKDSKNNKRMGESKVWRNVQILLDYCSELLQIMSTTK
jgi:hypothetical protein